MEPRKIAIIGLGYVGLSLASAFGQQQKVIGFDKKTTRINELKKGYDRNGETSQDVLSKLDILLTHHADDLATADFYIITVPTPVTTNKEPDLTLLLDASKIIGKYLKKGDIVVYESTVYPGATEEECVPVLEKTSHLKNGVDFKVGYSPERINPGDVEHTLATAIKIVSGQDEEALNIIANVYETVAKAGVYRAPNIKTAEAAKVIENTQRDLNVSLINELALIFHRLGVDTNEVLKAAATKWNFLCFKPGLVGGHCIGVDPYYLTYKAKVVGYFPDVILAGRRVNDQMGKFIAERTIKNLIKLGIPVKHCRIAVLGITFKENCPDTRNSRVMDLIAELQSYNTEVLVHDPVVKYAEIQEEYAINLVEWQDIRDVSAIILTVAHQQYIDLDKKELKEKLNFRGLIMDVKSILNPQEFKESGIMLWRL